MMRRALHLIACIFRHLLFQNGTALWEVSYLLSQKYSPDPVAKGANMPICWEQPLIEPTRVRLPGTAQFKWQGSWHPGDMPVAVHKRRSEKLSGYPVGVSKRLKR